MRKTVITKTVFVHRLPVFVEYAHVLAQDAARFHVAVHVHLYLESKHRVNLSALFRCQGVEGLRHHAGVGTEKRVLVPFELLQRLPTASDGS